MSGKIKRISNSLKGSLAYVNCQLQLELEIYQFHGTDHYFE
ncbi:hypothetical protein [Bacillus cereus]|uniref:Uncharacterized protein n=1 Tax=Bacillus cereus TaxID=1396 RepID=A0A0G8EPJ9_BACCE|nr:hypothetical protein [Bacillus cereus]KLA26181.1 hypothetical protein B4077_6071 [Bacillus cereus]